MIEQTLSGSYAERTLHERLLATWSSHADEAARRLFVGAGRLMAWSVFVAAFLWWNGLVVHELIHVVQNELDGGQLATFRVALEPEFCQTRATYGCVSYLGATEFWTVHPFNEIAAWTFQAVWVAVSLAALVPPGVRWAKGGAAW